MRKYPRTPHLPWSPGATADDERIVDVSAFEGREVVVTEKMDGECTTIHQGGCHARSLDTAPHESRDWVRALAGRVKTLIRPGCAVVGENLFAEHSIHYSALPSYFLAFGIHTAAGRSAAWSEVELSLLVLGLRSVPVLYRGIWNEAKVRACFTAGKSRCGGEQEGYVVRLADEFPLDDFGRSVAKYVHRASQTDEDWLRRTVVKNGLAR